MKYDSEDRGQGNETPGIEIQYRSNIVVASVKMQKHRQSVLSVITRRTFVVTGM